MVCVICKKGLAHGLSLHRINAKGRPGLWACTKHLPETDGPPVDPIVRDIMAALGAK